MAREFDELEDDETTISGNLRKKGWAPVVVVHKNQANLILNANWVNYDFAPAVAKLWQTKYRGEIYLHVPRKTKQVDVVQNKDWPVQVTSFGLVGIAVLYKIEEVGNEKDWQ
jgi:hypothetical protein